MRNVKSQTKPKIKQRNSSAPRTAHAEASSDTAVTTLLNGSSFTTARTPIGYMEIGTTTPVATGNKSNTRFNAINESDINTPIPEVTSASAMPAHKAAGSSVMARNNAAVPWLGSKHHIAVMVTSPVPSDATAAGSNMPNQYAVSTCLYVVTSTSVPCIFAMVIAMPTHVHIVAATPANAPAYAVRKILGELRLAPNRTDSAICICGASRNETITVARFEKRGNVLAVTTAEDQILLNVPRIMPPPVRHRDGPYA